MLVKAATTATPPKQIQAEYVHRAAWKAGMLGSLNVLFAVIAARFILLIAVGGALMLAWETLQFPPSLAMPALAMLGVYCVLVVVPMIWLASRK